MGKGVCLEEELEFELKRPSLYATLLWGLGIALIALTIYSMITWGAWMENGSDALLVFVAFTCALNSIATGFLIDMHTLEYKGMRIKIKRR